jgi:hypothetical protein
MQQETLNTYTTLAYTDSHYWALKPSNVKPESPTVWDHKGIVSSGIGRFSRLGIFTDRFWKATRYRKKLSSIALSLVAGSSGPNTKYRDFHVTDSKKIQ